MGTHVSAKYIAGLLRRKNHDSKDKQSQPEVEPNYVFTLTDKNGNIIDQTNLDENDKAHALELFRDEFGHKFAELKDIHLVSNEDYGGGVNVC